MIFNKKLILIILTFALFFPINSWANVLYLKQPNLQPITEDVKPNISGNINQKNYVNDNLKTKENNLLIQNQQEVNNVQTKNYLSSNYIFIFVIIVLIVILILIRLF